MQRRKLQVNIQSLSAESRIIKQQVKSSKSASVQASLREHLVKIVRPELRATHLLYAFLTGVAYREAEKDSHLTQKQRSSILRKVSRKCKRHNLVADGFEDWLNAGG